MQYICSVVELARLIFVGFLRRKFDMLTRVVHAGIRKKTLLEREISTEGVDPDRVKGSSRKSATRDDGRNGRKQAAAAKQVLRSTGSVDRTCTTCTVSESGRPPGRPK